MIIRTAEQRDIMAIVNMLADDELGALREDVGHELSDSYHTAFKEIDKDPAQILIVVENRHEEIVGTLQLSMIRYLTYRGGLRAQIEAVRVQRDHRGQGIGQTMIRWAVDKAIDLGAHVIQLTTDKKRPDAIRFYESIGFRASHEGMKMHL